MKRKCNLLRLKELGTLQLWKNQVSLYSHKRNWDSILKYLLVKAKNYSWLPRSLPNFSNWACKRHWVQTGRNSLLFALQMPSYRSSPTRSINLEVGFHKIRMEKAFPFQTWTSSCYTQVRLVRRRLCSREMFALWYSFYNVRLGNNSSICAFLGQITILIWMPSLVQGIFCRI